MQKREISSKENSEIAKTILLISFITGILLITIFSVSIISAYSSASSQFYSFNYGYGTDVDLYPSFDEKQCGAGQDFIIQVDPLGCEPSVVRSDLLEEQNVPVFCPLRATKLNPLINVEAIDSISFNSPGGYPESVSGVGFHPARAGIKGSYKTLLNSPVMENIGYAVIVLKKQKNESAMPDFVQGNLTAKIRYDVNNAFGVGKATYYLPELTDSEWEKKHSQYGFWQGRGFLKVEDIDSDSRTASIGVYRDVDSKISSVTLEKGKKSNMIYLPGFYCRAGLQIKLDDLEAPGTRAKLNINGDIIEVADNEKFLDNNCRITDITKQGIVKRVQGRCRTDSGTEKFDFEINPKIKLKINGKEEEVSVGDYLYHTDGDDKFVYLGYVGTKGNSGNKEDLYAYLVAIPTLNKDKRLSEDELYSVARLASYYENKGILSSASFSDFVSRSAKYIIGGTTEFASWLVSGKSVKRAEFFNTEEFRGGNVQIIDYGGTGNKDLSEKKYSRAKEYYDNALKDFRTDIDSFPNEKQEPSDLETFGEKALFDSIEVSYKLKQNKDLKDLCKEFEERYPKSNKKVENYCNKDELLSSSSLNSESFLINGNSKTISLEGIYEPTADEYSAEINVNGIKDEKGNKITKSFTLRKNQPVYLDDKGKDSIQLVDLDEKYATLRVIASKDNGGIIINNAVDTTQRLKVNLGQSFETPYVFTLTKINLKKQAKVSVIPNIEYTETNANFSFNIGIEKRAIQLSPEKTKEMIENINKSIEKWNKISEGLGKTVKALKGACFLTGTYLTVKNFFEGFGGKAGARHTVTEFYRNQCEKEIKGNSDLTMEKCLIKYNGDIENDVKGFADIVSNQEDFTNKDLCSGRAKNLLDNLGNELSDPSGGSQSINLKNLNSALNLEEDKDNQCNSPISSSDAGKIELYNKILSSKDVSDIVKDEIKIKRYNLLKEMSNDVKGYSIATSLQKKLSDAGFDKITIPFYGEKDSIKGEYSGQLIKGENFICDNCDDDDVHDGLEKETDYPIQLIVYNNQKYVLILEGSNKKYHIKDRNVYEFKQAKNGEITVSKVTDVILKEKINGRFSSFEKFDAYSYKNTIDNPEVIYWETGKNKGLPAIVPFDVKNGWYAATQPLSIDSMSAYDKSGIPSSFYVCNVMGNHRQDGISDDNCMEVLNGNVQGKGFKGLDESKMKRLVRDAQSALREASSQYKSGIKYVTINGERIKVGNPAVNLPGTQCEDFMSPKDCNVLFNVCDPVVCPSSRCDYGGRYPVSNVIQSGIIGSAVLCLPNFGKPSDGGVVIPVCLSGLNAGVESWTSVLKNYRDCLQKNLDTGETVGVCDEIQSIYMCEFFWRQIIPFADIIVPKVISGVYSGSLLGNSEKGKGGGEYMMVQEAWNNAEKSVDYMTNYYAANSYKAFKTRSTDEVGSTLCKLSVSARYPSSGDFFDALLEPDVPAQYSGWFQEIPYTSSTIPPTSQYKLFYHIYAGKDTGVYYSVYLRNPSSGSYYNEIPTISLPSGKGTGYIDKGDYASETVDFTAPSGYQEMCINVNGQEECGFKQASTSFALDYVSDQYVKDQVNNTNIKTEKECVSGSSSLSGLLTNPNLQAGVETSINPELYNRGITRICSTENPGMGTDPKANGEGTRWVEVGSCDNNQGNLKCWLDTQSVKDAVNFNITASETLKGVTDNFFDKITKEGNYFSEGENGEAKKELEKIRDMENNQDIIDTITEDYIKKFFFNKEKAELYLRRGEAYANLAIDAFNNAVKSEREKVKAEEHPLNLDYEKFDADKLIKSTYSNCKQYLSSIKKYANENEIDPLLLMAVMMQESECEYDAQSGTSYGLMQISEGTFNEVCKKKIKGVTEFNDVLGKSNTDKNIECGAMILKKKYDIYKNGKQFTKACSEEYKNKYYSGWDAALRGYNGWGCNKEYPEQDYYVEKVNAIYNELLKQENKKVIFNSENRGFTTYDDATFYRDPTTKDWMVNIQGPGGAKNYPAKDIDKLLFVNQEIKDKAKELISSSDTTSTASTTSQSNSQSSSQRDEWTLFSALEEVKTLKGYYSDNQDNKKFVDQLFDDRLLDKTEYIDIKGDGVFNLEESMGYVRNMLLTKCAKDRDCKSKYSQN